MSTNTEILQPQKITVKLEDGREITIQLESEEAWNLSASELTERIKSSRSLISELEQVNRKIIKNNQELIIESERIKRQLLITVESVIHAVQDIIGKIPTFEIVNKGKEITDLK